MGRGGNSGGNLFGGGEPEDEIPLSDLIPGLSRERRQRSRPVSSLWVRRGGPAARPRRGRLVLRVVPVCAVALLGALMMAYGATAAVDGYNAAGAMAAAPACPAGVDLITDTSDCVGNAVMSAQYGAFPMDQGESLDLPVSPADGYDLWPEYPGNAAFDAVLGEDDTYPVRAEFWEGNIVTLTAARGSDVQSVTTDQNPNNQGGTGLGAALLGVGFAALALLLLIGIRAFRLRWLRPGLGLRLTVSGLIVGGVGLFVAAACLMVQPARILLTLTIAPIVTPGVLLFVWLLIYNGARRQGLRGTAARRLVR